MSEICFKSVLGRSRNKVKFSFSLVLIIIIIIITITGLLVSQWPSQQSWTLSQTAGKSSGTCCHCFAVQHLYAGSCSKSGLAPLFVSFQNFSCRELVDRD